MRSMHRRWLSLLAAFVLATVAVTVALTSPPGGQNAPPAHPRLLFDRENLEQLRANVRKPGLAPIADRLIDRARALLTAPPLVVSTTRRGEPDPPGQLKGIEAARRLQGRVLTCSMAFLLTGERRFRDAAVAELDHAIADWAIWVDTAHQPPYDLMSGEVSLTFGLAYDWLYESLTPQERTRLREGVERRAMAGYLEAATSAKPPFWFTADHNWNPVCNGGATVLALALGSDSPLSDKVLRLAAQAMAHYWNHLQPDGAWDEGTGYWTYGHRYAFMAAEALRRAGRPEGAEYLGRPGARTTGMFPILFNPGRTAIASFGDSPSRVADPILYFLAREYRNPAFAWFEDREKPRSLKSEGWPDEALALIWRDPASAPGSLPTPAIPPVAAFTSIGWAMLAPAQPDPPFFLGFKNGSLAANHSHLDLNHVSVGVGETVLLPDLGSRPYPADYFDPPKRFAYYEITTAGHNSVLVGGKGQVPGRAGAMESLVEGPQFASVVGIADHAYEVATPVARRTVVLVDHRYYVLLDEVAPSTSQTIELRFHTYASPTEARAGAYGVTANGVGLDLVVADPALMVGSVAEAAGWIKPVKVVRSSLGRRSTGWCSRRRSCLGRVTGPLHPR